MSIESFDFKEGDDVVYTTSDGKKIVTKVASINRGQVNLENRNNVDPRKVVRIPVKNAVSSPGQLREAPPVVPQVEARRGRARCRGAQAGAQPVVPEGEAPRAGRAGLRG